MVAPRRKIGRRSHPFAKHPEVAEHIAHIGQITFAWTRLHSRLFFIFVGLLDSDHKLASGLWHCVFSDSYQRDLLMAAARSKLDVSGKRGLLKSVAWVVERTAKLAQHRNDISTRAYCRTAPTLPPITSPASGRARRGL
jgi:hypothetical protein